MNAIKQGSSRAPSCQFFEFSADRVCSPLALSDEIAFDSIPCMSLEPSLYVIGDTTAYLNALRMLRLCA